MDIRRAFPFLLLMICAAFAIRKGNYGGFNNIRRIRKISLSEYLVPPPPPKFHLGRIPRTVPSSTEKPGYLDQLMQWFNPFSYGDSPPPPPTSYETPYSPSPKFSQSPPPPPFANFGKPPLPSPTFNSNSEYSTSTKAKDCNPCNTVPWTPIQGDVTHSVDASYASSTLQVLPTNGDYPPPINVKYPPLGNPEVAYDTNYAASQKIRAPDYIFVPTLSTVGQDLKYPSFNSHSNIYRYPIYIPTSSSITNPGVINQELGYNTPSASNGQFGVRDHGAHNDLSSSGTQVAHANPVPDNQGFENIATHQGSPDSLHQQTFDGPNAPSEVLDNEGPYVTRSLDDLSDNSSQIDQNPANSYEISGPDQVPNSPENQYSDLSSSGNVAKDTYASPRAPADTSKIKDSVYFEESPLLDFTHKGESRTRPSSIPPTSNAITEIAESAGSTLAPGEEVFGIRQEAAPTKIYSFQSTDLLASLQQPKINNSLTQNSDRSVYNSKVMREQNISYSAPSSAQTTMLQSSSILTTVTTTTTTTTTPKSLLSRIFSSFTFWNTDEKSANDTMKEEPNQNANVSSNVFSSERQRGVKKNKQVQVIIPYTQQYTPLPFYTQKVPQAVSNSDNYVAEGSANTIKVTSFSDSPNTHQTRPTTSTISEDHTRKPAGTSANNSIDVHKLQKNIDNWIIQEYSKSTTASTASPSSANPYLLPSKKIPHEYLTTTESLEHIASPHENDNAKIFTLSGFTFNDIDYKASTSNRVEQKSQMAQKENSPNDASPKDVWRDFSVSISPMNKERVYVVTSQSVVTTPKSNPVEQKKEKAKTKEAERNPKESRQVSETDTKKSTTNSDAFEKAYQVLPQAVNNLAVASTGPESVPLWSIMEHQEFALLDDNEQETDEADESQTSTTSHKRPLLYSGHSKVSRTRR